MPTALVIGGSGFLGSHVARQLVADGVPTRVMLRSSSPTKGIEDLDVERCYGDVFDAGAVQAAMDGVADVYYCVVDTRAWLRDPGPLFRTNVEGLRVVLDIAATMPLSRFVFTSSLVTLALAADRLVTEADPHNWVARGGAYVASRVAAEELLLSYVRERGLPGIAMCVSNTYGSRDHVPTPHGQLVALAARGKLPFYLRGAASDVVAIDDAARALVLAASKGRIGERYFVGERWMTAQEIATTAAEATGVRPPRWGIPLRVMKGIGPVGSGVSKLVRRDLPLTPTTVRLTHIQTPIDHSKAQIELGWTPRPTPDAIREAAEFFTRRR